MNIQYRKQEIHVDDIFSKHKIINVSIDRFYIGLNKMSIGTKLFGMFDFKQRHKNRFYHYKHSSRGLTIYVNPKFPNIVKVKIIINTRVYRTELPQKIKDILRLSQDWFLSALDIAYDFNIPMSKTYAMVRANAKKKRREENKNIYYFSRRNESHSLLYDKKEQLESKGKQVKDDNWIRYEIRLRPKTKTPIYNLEFDYLKPLIEKHYFVSDYTNLNLTSEEKEIIRQARDKRVNQDFNFTSKYKADKIRRAIRVNSVPFYELFESEKKQLLSYITSNIGNEGEV